MPENLNNLVVKIALTTDKITYQKVHIETFKLGELDQTETIDQFAQRVHDYLIDVETEI